MSWTDKLFPGSFRGVPFLTQGHDLPSAGRRVQTHEYPGGEIPWSEDLGKRAGQWRIQCHVLGPDWDVQRDALVAAANRPGPGTLVHPYLGTLQVHCRQCEVTETSDEGRMARLQLLFVESGVNRQPAATADTAALLVAGASRAQAAVSDRFAREFRL